MSDLKLKTNVSVRLVLKIFTPYMDEVVGAGAWEVDLTNPNRILTVKTDATELNVKEAPS
ncbi:MAG: heavy metal transport/detoxification protein [Cytophagales bacterium]|nr:heavy metal transport/detoxification protein [Cytophagales bacterium]